MDETCSNQGAAANRRLAGQADGAGNLSAAVAAVRAFPAAVVLLALLNWGCSKNPTVITGQIFEVAKGGENIKMGAVAVHVVPDESFKLAAHSVLEVVERQYSVETARKASRRACQSLLDEIKAIQNGNLQVAGIEELRKEVEKEKNVQELKPDEFSTMWLDSLTNILPPTTVKTDADGRFITEVNSKVWLVAVGRRNFGNETKKYLWLLPYEMHEDGIPQAVVISNDASINNGEDLYKSLAPLAGKDGSLNRFENAKPSAGVELWVAQIKDRISKMIAKAKEEKLYANSLGMKFVAVPATQVLMCIHETRNADYAIYAAAQTERVDDEWRSEAKVGKEQHPVVCVSYEDAESFCRWLGVKEGKKYRLPTDAEWSAAVGLLNETGQTPNEKWMNTSENVFPWGRYYPPSPQDGNYDLEEVDDGYERTAPVMSFRSNNLGIYDLGGNVTEWCQDWFEAKKEYRVIRGSAWHCSVRWLLASSFRDKELPKPIHRYNFNGFRCVLELNN